MALTGEVEGRPMRAGLPIADLTAGMWAAMGALAAIIQRQATGQGQEPPPCEGAQQAGYTGTGRENRRQAKRRGLKGRQKDAYVYGTLNKIESQHKNKRRGRKR